MAHDTPRNGTLSIADLFDLAELQAFQDSFATATGVASVITLPDGTPLTRPTNFCRLCNDIVRGTEIGRRNCYRSDVILSRPDTSGPTVSRCASSGLWDAGASIVVNGQHLANWLIGQVRTESMDLDAMAAYADKIGADRRAYREALSEVPIMPLERFREIARSLHLLAAKISERAYRGILQNRMVEAKAKAEARLRASEMHFRRVLELAPLPMAITRMDGSVEYLNKRFTDTLGYTLEDIPDLDSWWPKAYPDPEYREYSRRGWNERVAQAVSASSDIHPEEHVLACKDGASRILEISGTSIGDRVLNILRDVTKERADAEKLAASEENLRTLFDSVGECIFVHDIATGRLLDVNQRALDTYGYTREAMLAVDVGTLSSGEPPYDQAHAIEHITNARTRGPQVMQWHARKANGELFWTEVSMRVARFGLQDRLIVSARDITDRVLAQEATLREKTFSEAVIDSVPGLVYVYDEEGWLVRWNRKHAELTGYSHEELANMRLEDWYQGDPEELARVMAAVARIPLDGYSEVEGNLRNKDGSKRLYYFTAVRLVLEGKSYFTGIGIDITERKRMHELMVQTEKMLSIGGLAAGMAHEINNPLSAILQSAQVLRRRLLEESPANAGACQTCGCDAQAMKNYLNMRGIPGMLDAIGEAGSRAANIVAHMLEFSRKAESSKHPVSVRELLERAVALSSNDYDMKKKYDFRKIAVRIEVQEDTPELPCTPTQIEQVLMNLLRNAAQAMNGSQAHCGAPVIILRARPEGGWVVIEVEDNGPGMPEAVRKRVFEPFFTTKAPGEGTGLGLSVSYFIIVENHRGSIEVASSLNVGTRFIIRLPLGPTRQDAPACAAL